MTLPKSRIALIGAGAIGRQHAKLTLRADFCTLDSIIDPTPDGQAFARQLDARWFPDLEAALAAGAPDAAILATPNQTHHPLALALIEAGIPTLIEKPIASTVEEAESIVRASAARGVPILVGHHRRHHPIIRRARTMIDEGLLGRLTAVSVLAMFYKPSEYFDAAWRRSAGAGPVLINLIHEVDLIRHLCGEIVSVQALTSNTVRGFEIEDSGAVILGLEGGAIATITLSDTVVAPWSWDLMSGEGENFPASVGRVMTHMLAGTEGSIALPTLEHWHYREKRSWLEPLTRTQDGYRPGDPYIAQLRNLCAVARGEEEPVVSAEEGTRTLRATLAIHDAARAGGGVRLT